MVAVQCSLKYLQLTEHHCAQCGTTITTHYTVWFSDFVIKELSVAH